MEAKFKLTSFYVNEEHLNKIKIYSIEKRTTIKDVLNNFIYLFNTNLEFKQIYENLITSGSL